MIRFGFNLAVLVALGLPSTTALGTELATELATDNPWRAPSQQTTPNHQYAPAERQAGPTRGQIQAPKFAAPRSGPGPAFPPPAGAALPQAVQPSQPAPYGFSVPNRAYPNDLRPPYPTYRGPAYGYRQPYPYPNSYPGGFPSPYLGGDPILRDSLFRSSGWGGFPGGWR
jgi:hypothetical protein